VAHYQCGTNQGLAGPPNTEDKKLFRLLAPQPAQFFDSKRGEDDGSRGEAMSAPDLIGQFFLPAAIGCVQTKVAGGASGKSPGRAIWDGIFGRGLVQSGHPLRKHPSQLSRFDGSGSRLSAA
jgi:hypothetical protein